MIPLAELKAELQKRGLRLNKKLGQHLLIDGNIRKNLVNAADISKSDIVVEIGPGTGFVTEILAEKAGMTYAVEIDRGFAGYLKDIFAGNSELTILHEDFLEMDFDKILCHVRENPDMELKIIGSLPYYITTQIMMKIIESNISAKLCAFIVQKEVAERYSAGPGSKLYGSITLFLRYRFRIEKVAVVGKSCFYPKPDVNSAIIRMTPLDKPPVSVSDESLLFALIRTAFGQRRKMLKNSIRALQYHHFPTADINDIFRDAEISSGTRPEQLSLEDFARIAEVIHSLRPEKQNK